MQFHFEKLGLLDEADLELADLTIICGENNTGKTYATYAVYGFLRSWRRLLLQVLESLLITTEQNTGSYKIDLQVWFSGKLNEYLAQLGKLYSAMLPEIFAANAAFFQNVQFCCHLQEEVHDFTHVTYQNAITHGQSGKVLATLRKEPGSRILEVLIASDATDSLTPSGLRDFIADAIGDIVFAPCLPDVFIASAERTGVAIFRKELDLSRDFMIEKIGMSSASKLGDSFRLMDNISTGYALPVKDNINFVRRLESLDRHTGALAAANPGLINDFNALLGGSYRVIQGKGLFYRPNDLGAEGVDTGFTMSESSSCVRALLDIGFYLRCVVKPGDVFMIDEPELNLHPKNQRAFARLIVRMVNAGLKVFLTTHSDYLVKEFNTLIMLAQKTEHTKVMQATHGYMDEELLDPQRVRLYMTSTELKPATGKSKSSKINTLKRAIIHPDRGIEATTFDTTIEEMNAIQSDILYGGAL